MDLQQSTKLAQQIAQQARKDFVQKTRPDGSVFWTVNYDEYIGKQNWITNMVKEVHKDPIRDNYRTLDDDLHNWIIEILDWIVDWDVENNGSIVLGYEIDNHINVMNDYDCIQWFGRNMWNQGITEEVTEEWHKLQKYVKESDTPNVMYLIREGMKRQMVETAACVRQHIFEQVLIHQPMYAKVYMDSHLDSDSILEFD